MKEKFMIIFVLFSIVFLIVSCNKNPNGKLHNSSKSKSSSSEFNEDEKDKQATDSDFTLFSYDDSISINRSDTLAEIKDKLNTSSLDKYGDDSLVKYQGTIICVRDDKYCEGFIILPYFDETVTFKTLRNIKIGSTLEQVKVAYGEPTMKMDGERLIIYVYKKNESKYLLLKEGEATEIATEYHYFQFTFSSGGNVSMITAGDYEFVYNRK